MGNNERSGEWPPEEAIFPATVVGRLDQLGWTVDCTELLEHTWRHALARYSDKLNPPRWPVIDLVDGHTVASYGTEDAAREAFAAISRGGEPDDD